MFFFIKKGKYLFKIRTDVIYIIETQRYKIEKLTWDTEFFNINSARVILEKEIDKMDLKKIQLYIQENNIKFATIQNNNNNEANNNILGTWENVYLADVNLKLMKKVEEKYRNYINDNIKISNNLPEDNNILNISNSSFIHSRFLIDKKLKNGNQVYGEWAKNSFNRKDKFFCYYNTNNKIEGFIIFSVDNVNSSIIIELMAIEKEYRNKGIGTSLVKNLENYALKENISYIKVGTQLNNIEAQNFYIKNNFKHYQNNSIYHLIKS